MLHLPTLTVVKPHHRASQRLLQLAYGQNSATGQVISIALYTYFSKDSWALSELISFGLIALVKRYTHVSLAVMEPNILRTVVAMSVGFVIGTILQGRKEGKSVIETLSSKKVYLMQVILGSAILVTAIEYFL